MNITKNFTIEELIKSETAERRGIDNTEDAKVRSNLIKLCGYILQPLREAYGRPIIISSGYRCRELNKAVGGAPNSDHLFGCAADIHSTSNTASDNTALFDLAVRLMQSGKIRNVKQIIDEYGYRWIHISFQDGRSSKRNQVLHLK